MMLAGLLNRMFPAIRHAEKFAQARLDTWGDWLMPLPEKNGSESGAGNDPAYEEAFFALKDEAGKLSEIDDSVIVRHCEQLVKSVGKDLRLAGYYATARLRRDGIPGFADGLELAAALVDRFGDRVLPARAQARCGALDMLSTPSVLEQLEASGSIARADLERTMAALDVLLGHAGKWPEASRPNLQALVSHFERAATTRGSETAQPTTVAPTKATERVTPAITPAAPVGSSRDVLAQASVMAHWLRDQEYGYLSAVRLVRSVRWDTLPELPPADVSGKTRLAPPRPELRQHLNRLVLQKQWPELLGRVEDAFVEAANHFWLDLQYFQHVALEHAGAPHVTWAAQLRTDIALLLERLPGIEHLAYDDGMPFADDVTREWLAQHAVVRDLAAGEGLAPLPVSADPSSDAAGPIGQWPEIEAQAREQLAEAGLEAAFAWLEALPGVKSHRHRFLQRLVMARVAEKAGRGDTAIALFGELDRTAHSLALTQWEPTLAFDIKRQLAQALKASGNRKDVDKAALARRVAELHAEMTVLDPVRVITSAVTTQ